MEELLKKCKNLEHDYTLAVDKLDIEKIQNELSLIDEKITAPDFWNDNKSAQEIMKQQSKLVARSKPWIMLGKQIH
jgi:peptide chain release factor 2